MSVSGHDTWSFSAEGAPVTVEVRASASGYRSVSINGKEIHKEWKPAGRLLFGPAQIPGIPFHNFTLEQKSLTKPLTFGLSIDDVDFSLLSPAPTCTQGDVSDKVGCGLFSWFS